MTAASAQFTDDFVVDALRHYRLQHPARRPMVALKVLITLPLVALAASGFIHAPFGLGLFFVALCLLLLFGQHIDLWLARRSVRKWAFRDESVEIDFTDEGFRARQFVGVLLGGGNDMSRKPLPDEPAALNAGVTAQLTIEDHWLGVGDPGR